MEKNTVRRVDCICIGQLSMSLPAISGLIVRRVVVGLEDLRDHI